MLGRIGLLASTQDHPEANRRTLADAGPIPQHGETAKDAGRKRKRQASPYSGLAGPPLDSTAAFASQTGYCVYSRSRIFLFNAGKAACVQSQHLSGALPSHPHRHPRDAARPGVSAGTIQEKLGVEQANLSQHLGVLRSRQIVVSRKDGNQVFYSIRNQMLVEVLDLMRRYFQANLADAIQLLGEVEREASAQ